MRRLWLALGLVCLALPVFAEEAATQGITLPSLFKADDSGRYNVKIEVAGAARLPGASQPTRIDALLDMTLAYSVGRLTSRDWIEVVISAERASATVAGQKVELPKDTFPKLTALVNDKGDVSSLLASEMGGQKLPGINYRNLILLFRPYAPAGELKPGATWRKTISLPPEPEKYEFSCTLQGLEDIGSVRTAKVRSDISVVPPEGSSYTASGFAVTNFSLDSGRLVKSHAEMVVKTPGAPPKTPAGTPAADSPGEIQATVKIDIQPAETAKPAK